MEGRHELEESIFIIRSIDLGIRDGDSTKSELEWECTISEGGRS